MLKRLVRWLEHRKQLRYEKVLNTIYLFGGCARGKDIKEHTKLGSIAYPTLRQMVEDGILICDRVWESRSRITRLPSFYYRIHPAHLGEDD